MKLVVTLPIEQDTILQPISELVRQLAAWDRYQPQVNDMVNLPDPYRYFLSRCVDKFIPSALAFLHWDSTQTIQLQELENLATQSPVIARLIPDSRSSVLASILRPCAEMFVDLSILDPATREPQLLGEISRTILLDAARSDYTQKLKACEEIYQCVPSYFTAATQTYADFLKPLKEQLNSIGINLSAGFPDQYLQVYKNASPLDRVLLGPDLFLAHSVLSYKLHFLPQQNVPDPDPITALLRLWCIALLAALGLRLLMLTSQPVDPAVTAWIGAFTQALQSPGSTNSGCPAVADIVMFDWGIARVEAVKSAPLGNEVLTVHYDIPFVPGLQSPDHVPQRFMKCRLDTARYEAAVKEEMASRHVDATTALVEQATQTHTMEALYMQLFECRDRSSESF